MLKDLDELLADLNKQISINSQTLNDPEYKFIKLNNKTSVIKITPFIEVDKRAFKKIIT